jgi:hypothetical protein
MPNQIIHRSGVSSVPPCLCGSSPGRCYMAMRVMESLHLEEEEKMPYYDGHCRSNRSSHGPTRSVISGGASILQHHSMLLRALVRK